MSQQTRPSGQRRLHGTSAIIAPANLSRTNRACPVTTTKGPRWARSMRSRRLDQRKTGAYGRPASDPEPHRKHVSPQIGTYSAFMLGNAKQRRGYPLSHVNRDSAHSHRGDEVVL